MTETHNPETGEIVSARIPAQITAAISGIMKKAMTLGYDENNQFSKYRYVSADKFFANYGPLMAQHGLSILMDEDSVEIKSGSNADSGKVTSWLHTRYKFTFVHESGEVYGPLFRTVIVPATGAQAFGSAQTYLLKQFLRATFLVPTGEKDEVDSQGETGLPNAGAMPSAPAKPQPAQSPPTQAGAPSSTTIVPNAADLDYARASFTAIRQQIAQSASVADVDAVMGANTKQLEDIKRIAGEPHWQKLLDSAKARKDMLAPESEPVP